MWLTTAHPAKGPRKEAGLSPETGAPGEQEVHFDLRSALPLHESGAKVNAASYPALPFRNPSPLSLSTAIP